jgi:membrane fusion protein (multidrug efflux system)
MDPKPFQAQLSQARAALAQAEAAKETARLNLERTRPLTALNALSQKDLDDATGQFQSAAAAVEQSKAEVESAELNLSYTTISSPVTGVSSSAKQTDGTYISTQNSLLTTVAAISPMWVNFSLSENQMQAFRDQTARGLLRMPRDARYTLEIVLVDGSVYPYTAQITFAEPSFNASTGTFLIRGSVANPEGILHPNQYVSARERRDPPERDPDSQRAVSRARRGISSGSSGRTERPSAARRRRRPVRRRLVHLRGLKAGDRVVVDGGLTLGRARRHGGTPSRRAQAPRRRLSAGRWRGRPCSRSSSSSGRSSRRSSR